MPYKMAWHVRLFVSSRCYQRALTTALHCCRCTLSYTN